MAPARQRIAKGLNATEIGKKIKRGNAMRQGTTWWSSRGLAAFLLVCLCLSAAATWLYVTSLDPDITETLVSQREHVSPQPRVYIVQCSEDYENYKRYPGCTPQKCGRAVADGVVTIEEVQLLRRLAERGLQLAGSEGGRLHYCGDCYNPLVDIHSILEQKARDTYHLRQEASILDLHSGALSMGKQFVNIYRNVRERIQTVIAETFGLDQTLMYLTKPTFFSRINSTTAKTQHDEYWHPHIDKVTYGSFDYTSLLYLSDYGSDFTGGRFVFMDQDGNKTVEPRAGRVSFFSSGSENLHRVETVSWGTRYAITVSFTCDPTQAIADPALP
ncbi:urotensin-2 receptor 2 isoform X2 [Entelurus aequoreus]|uniref:urotensin-2 receptor 2 isoform X2 n=1 Tax=Entelurus aequoreus TaxID=161455 RepID=UPI002B1CFE73|nr:urotensin-2 receptor 2 isoform X2 [Entelurus aequoreus]